jgi:hypothetical protein
MATTLNIDRIWLGSSEFEVLAGAIFVVSVGWTVAVPPPSGVLEDDRLLRGFRRLPS